CARMRRQPIEFPDVAAPNHRIVGLERGDEAGHDVGNVTAPFLLAVALESGTAHVVLIGTLLVGQVTEFHGLHDSVHNQAGSKSRSEAEKEHLAAVVAPKSLHRRVVDDLHRAAERCREVEPDPSASEVIWFGNWTVVQDWTGIPDRHHVIPPTSGQPL